MAKTKTARWSQPRRATAKNVSRIPNKKGSYQIGFCKKRSDGKKHFNPQYTGSSTSSMKTRVASHVRGTGNKAVKKYNRTSQRNNLHVRYKTGDVHAEARQLNNANYGEGSGNPWNKKEETQKYKQYRTNQKRAATRKRKAQPRYFNQTMSTCDKNHI